MKKEDPFDVEAYAELVKLNIVKLEKREFDETSSRTTDKESWELLDEFSSYYDRIQKIDNEKIADKAYGKYKEKVYHYAELIAQVEVENKELEELTERVNKCLADVYEIATYYANNWFSEIAEKYFTTKLISAVTTAKRIHGIIRDGILRCDTYKKTNSDTSDSEENTPEIITSMEEIRKIVELIEEETKNI